MMSRLVIRETDESGVFQQTIFCQEGRVKTRSRGAARMDIAQVFCKVFLPIGFPESVSPDYLRYQILNASQAFSIALAGMISSRAIMQAFGVGDASASATNAMLLLVSQDFCNRLTAVIGAYYIGSSLSSEAKRYRFFADVIYDTSIVLDAMSPFLLVAPWLRIVALCISGSLRAISGIATWGSRAAINLHFATSVTSSTTSTTGDVGDINAKETSMEGVFSLLGMLVGIVVVPTSSRWAYIALFVLLGIHLTISYAAVRGLELRSLNRQRASLVWSRYRASEFVPPSHCVKERLFVGPGALFDENGAIVGYCTLGGSLPDSLISKPLVERLLEIFRNEKYILWPLDDMHFHVCFMLGYSSKDELRAWIHATEMARLGYRERVKDYQKGSSGKDGLRYASKAKDHVQDLFNLIIQSHSNLCLGYSDFILKLQDSGWDHRDGIKLVQGRPKALSMGVEVDDRWYCGE
ncbi:vitamin B6 photo-protection and homoeostasis-domain-containing protein [Mycena floridula]|nr:vitamin B6 photo-protection and homoeostasis-domain-containing protein [Mycena floridula]